MYRLWIRPTAFATKPVKVADNNKWKISLAKDAATNIETPITKGN